MPTTILERLKRKPVEIRAGGIGYKGILIEVTATEITLRGKTGFISIPMERITSVTDPNSQMSATESKFVDPSYYSADQEQEEPTATEDAPVEKTEDNSDDKKP